MKVLTLEDFAPLVNEEFAVANASVGLTLTEAKSKGQARPFYLTFTGPSEAAFDQGTLTLSHPRLGENDIFLVPISDDGTQRRYEAVFN